MRIARHPKFVKKLARLPSWIQLAVAQRTALFVADARHPLLNDHALSGEREGQRSFNLTGDWRLIYEPIEPDLVLFVDVNTHHNLYGS